MYNEVLHSYYNLHILYLFGVVADKLKIGREVCCERNFSDKNESTSSCVNIRS